MTFCFHDSEEVGPAALANLSKRDWLAPGGLVKILLAAWFLAAGFATGQSPDTCSDTKEIDKQVSRLAKDGLKRPWRRFEQPYSPVGPWQEVSQSGPTLLPIVR
jgi:hypothetical protein